LKIYFFKKNSKTIQGIEVSLATLHFLVLKVFYVRW